MIVLIGVIQMKFAEKSQLNYESDGYVVLVTHPVSAVVSVNVFTDKLGGVVQLLNDRLGAYCMTLSLFLLINWSPYPKPNMPA